MNKEKRRHLPYGQHWIDADDTAAVVEALNSGSLTGGPRVEHFEQVLADKVGAPRAVSCANGTAALHLATMALGLGPGDLVVVPALTFVATANAVRFTGANVIFSDVDPDTGLASVEQIEQAIDLTKGSSVAAVYPVHLNGQCCDMPAIAALCNARKLRLVEDACHALGTIIDDKNTHVGSCKWSDVTCFSFHPVKTVAMDEGGALTCRDDELAQSVKCLRSHGIVCNSELFEEEVAAFDSDSRLNPWYYEMQELGYNYRLSDVNAALGLSQLGKLERFVERRRDLVAQYDRLFERFDDRVRPITRVRGQRAAWHLYPIHMDFQRLGLSRAYVMEILFERGIRTQVHYVPVYRHPYYRRLYGEIHLPGAEKYYANVLTLPLYPKMADTDVEFVVETLSRIVRGR